MKRWICLFLVLAATLSLCACSIFEDDAPSFNPFADIFDDHDDSDDFFLSYLPGNSQVKGNTLYVDGMFSNSSSQFDIVDLSDIQIVVTDEYGNEQALIRLNSKFSSNCIIPPYGTVPYNFTCDVSGFTVDSLWDLRYDVLGEYYYAECEGSQCEYCGGRNTNGTAPGTNIQIPDAPGDQEYTLVICPNCNGNKKCTDCNGSGKNDFDGVLAAYGCTLCDKTGKCHKCGGTGSIKVY